MDLQSQAPMWATPGATDGKGSSRPGQRRGQLSEHAEQGWATPKASDGSKPSAGNRRTADLSHQAEAPTSGETSSNPPRGSRPQLNPAFVWWLMGLPWWWGNIDITSSAPPATEWFRLRRRELSSSFGIGCTPIDTPGSQARRVADAGTSPAP